MILIKSDVKINTVDLCVQQNSRALIWEKNYQKLIQENHIVLISKKYILHTSAGINISHIIPLPKCTIEKEKRRQSQESEIASSSL